MEELLEEKERLENELWDINVKITELKIKDEQKRLRDICNKTNEDFVRGLDYIFMSKLMLNYNHRGRNADFFYELAEEKLGVKREMMYEIGEMYDKFIGYYDFEFFEDYFDLGLKIKRGEMDKIELVINRP